MLCHSLLLCVCDCESMMVLWPQTHVCNRNGAAIALFARTRNIPLLLLTVELCVCNPSDLHDSPVPLSFQVHTNLFSIYISCRRARGERKKIGDDETTGRVWPVDGDVGEDDVSGGDGVVDGRGLRLSYTHLPFTMPVSHTISGHHLDLKHHLEIFSPDFSIKRRG